jgi:hypothetical protein
MIRYHKDDSRGSQGQDWNPCYKLLAMQTAQARPTDANIL